MTELPFFSLDMPLDPVPKGRPRVGRGGRIYTPATTRNYEDAIRLQTRVMMAPRHPTKMPCRIAMRFVFAWPKSWNGAKRASQRHVTRPDVDNLVKAFLDGICGPSFAIHDDKQVVEISACKLYGKRGSVAVDVWEVVDESQLLASRWRDWK